MGGLRSSHAADAEAAEAVATAAAAEAFAAVAARAPIPGHGRGKRAGTPSRWIAHPSGRTAHFSFHTRV